MLKHCCFHQCVNLCSVSWCRATHPLGLIVVPSQCHAHRCPLTKIPTSISRVAASLDKPRPSTTSVLPRLKAKVGGWKYGGLVAGVVERI